MLKPKIRGSEPQGTLKCRRCGTVGDIIEQCDACSGSPCIKITCSRCHSYNNVHISDYPNLLAAKAAAVKKFNAET